MRRLALALLILAVCAFPAQADAPHAVGQMLGTEPTREVWTTWVWWSGFETEPGVYNYAMIDEQVALAREAGAVIQTQLIAYTGDVDRQPYFIDWTPSFYPQGYVLESGGYKAVLPAYDNETWRNAYLRAGAAFAAYCDDIPEIVSVIVATGIDGETQFTKVWGVNWQTVAASQAGGTEYRFGQFVYQAMDAYADAVDRVQLHLNCAPGAADRMERAAHADALGIALKHSGMAPDMDSYEGVGTYTGSWDHIRAYPERSWVESPTGNGANAEWGYWAMLAGLCVHPMGMDVHREILERVDSWVLDWVGQYVNRTISDTPGAWVVFRDREYPLVTWGNAGISGKNGPHEFYASVSGEWTAETKAELPVGTDHSYYARQAGLVTRAIIDVDDAFQRDSYTLRLVYLDHGAGTFTVNGTRLKLGNTGTWQAATMSLDGWQPTESIIIESEDGVYVHMVEVLGKSAAQPTATSTPRPTATATRTATPTATRTETPTAVIQKTWTPAPTQTPWIVTATPEPTLTTSELVEELKFRFAQMGLDARVFFEVLGPH